VTIIFGSEALDGNTTIELNGSASAHTAMIEGVSEISLVGDIDGDGVDNVFLGSRNWGRFELYDYFFEPAHILRGSEQITPNRKYLLDDFADSGNLSEPLAKTRRARVAGDINGDGLDDAILEFGFDQVGVESAILFGNTKGDLATETLRLEAPFMYGAFEMAGDYDGDGFDDLLFSHRGDDCRCGVSGRPSVSSGVLVVYGGTSDETNPFPIGTRTTSILIDRVSPYNPFATTGFAHFVNVDGDERADIAFRPEGELLIVIRGQSNPTDIDFGHVWDGTTQFDGDLVHGWTIPSTGVRYIDLNGDGLTDFLADDRIYLGTARQSEAVGEGNLSETLNFGANTSVTYEVTGRIRTNPSPISTVALDVSQRDSDLTNNAVSNRTPVLLNMEVQQTQEQDEHTIVVEITNQGPHNATGVTLQETLTDGLSNVTWERTLQAFPAEIPLAILAPGLGVSLVGPDTELGLYLEITPTAIQRKRYFDGPFYTDLGKEISSLGDINGDGIDDVVVNWFTQTREGSRPIPLYVLGSNQFAKEGFQVRSNFEAVPNEVGTREIAFGDLNNDGFQDAVNAIGGDHGFGPGEVSIVFGGPDNDPTVIPDRVRIQFPPPFNGDDPVVLSGFDINGDGIDDLLIGNSGEGAAADLGEITMHGAAHVIFGRSADASSGTGSQPHQFDVPVGGTVTVTLRGISATTPRGQIQLSVAPDQIDLGSDSKIVFTPEPVRGDFNNDGAINFDDFLILSANFGQSDTKPHEGDLNLDSKVSFADFLILSAIIGSQQ